MPENPVFRENSPRSFPELYNATKHLVGEENYTKELQEAINKYYSVGGTSYDFENDVGRLEQLLNHAPDEEEEKKIRAKWISVYLGIKTKLPDEMTDEELVNEYKDLQEETKKYINYRDAKRTSPPESKELTSDEKFRQGLVTQRFSSLNSLTQVMDKRHLQAPSMEERGL